LNSFSFRNSSSKLSPQAFEAPGTCFPDHLASVPEDESRKPDDHIDLFQELVKAENVVAKNNDVNDASLSACSK
jgi:hypothetical protein